MREERKFIAELEKSIKYGSEPMSNAVLGVQIHIFRHILNMILEKSTGCFRNSAV